jgi:hypothetical protein
MCLSMERLKHVRLQQCCKASPRKMLAPPAVGAQELPALGRFLRGTAERL